MEQSVYVFVVCTVYMFVVLACLVILHEILHIKIMQNVNLPLYTNALLGGPVKIYFYAVILLSQEFLLTMFTPVTESIYLMS